MTATDWDRPFSRAEMEAIRRAAGGRARAERNERRVRQDFWTRFRRVARHIPFAEDVLAAFYCATDPSTPLRVRAILFAALVGLLWPSSFIPRLALAVGILDEAALVVVFFRTLGGAIKPHHRERARQTLQAGL